MKYRIGDEVRIRDDLVVRDSYPMEDDPEQTSMFAPDMYKYIGTKTRIKGITVFADGARRYALVADEGSWNWSDSMLEPVEEQESPSSNRLAALSPDAPVVVNEAGGKQSDTPYAFHMLPLSAVFAAAEVCAYGAKKYGESLDNRNYIKIPTEEHINHAIAHLYAYLSGDVQDDHLGHAIVRCMFAYDTAQGGNTE